jgi:hypothetical protein
MGHDVFSYNPGSMLYRNSIIRRHFTSKKKAKIMDLPGLCNLLGKMPECYQQRANILIFPLRVTSRSNKVADDQFAHGLLF